jgi:hypothetical protein
MQQGQEEGEGGESMREGDCGIEEKNWRRRALLQFRANMKSEHGSF